MSFGRLAIFLGVMTTLVALTAFYVGVRLIPPTWTGVPKAAAWGGLVLLVVAWPSSFLLRFLPWHRGAGADAVSFIAYASMGLFLLILTFTLLRDVGWLGFKVAGQLPADPARRDAIFQMSNAAVLGLGGAAFLLGLVRAVQKPTVVSVTVPIKGLPKALEGFTIAQISDVHIGPTIKRGFLEDVVATVNGLQPDLIAVTGDLVDGSVAELREHTAPLAALRARHGAWFITGNHEYYSGALDWLDEVRRLGINTLVNEHKVVDHDGHSVVVAGVTDFSAGGIIPAHASDPAKAVAGAPADAAVKLLLAHQPRSAYDAEKAGFHLQLSGHTHGGQFFPGTLLVRLAQPFVEGLHQLNSMWVYTNRGTGYWGPPVRHTTITSEVTRLTLVAA